MPIQVNSRTETKQADREIVEETGRGLRGFRDVLWLTLVLSVFLILFFFLPWASWTWDKFSGCFTGWQLTVGQVSGVYKVPEPTRSPVGMEVRRKWPELSSRPWLILGLLVPIALLVFCAAALVSHMARKTIGVVLTCLGLLGLIVATCGIGFDYSRDVRSRLPEWPPANAPFEERLNRQLTTGMAFSSKTMTALALWFSLGTYVIIGASGVTTLGEIRGSKESGTSFPEPGGESD
ncbi:MAG: hypothetical protein JW955_04090 [Sedimentisphaerales bacterium]|nr:hypothetical protein [Sedimentisphaerales bacterium]